MHLHSLDCDENVVAGFILPSLIFPDEAVHRQPFFKERDAPVAASLDVDQCGKDWKRSTVSGLSLSHGRLFKPQMCSYCSFVTNTKRY